MKDNTMIFMFHDPDFFSDLFANGTNQQDNDDTDRQKRYGKLLYVDFEGIARNANGDGKIELKVDEKFDCNDDYIEKISVMSSDRMAVAFSSGKIIIRQVKTTAVASNTCSSIDKVIIPCPENLKEELDADLDEMDTDGPSLCSSRNGRVLLLLRYYIYQWALLKTGILERCNASHFTYQIKMSFINLVPVSYSQAILSR